RGVLRKREYLGVVAQLLVLHQGVSDVDAEAVHALLDPELDDAIELVADCRVRPVQVGLFAMEEMEVVLAALLVEGPRRPSEMRYPVVRRPSVAPGAED